MNWIAVVGNLAVGVVAPLILLFAVAAIRDFLVERRHGGDSPKPTPSGPTPAQHRGA